MSVFYFWGIKKKAIMQEEKKITYTERGGVIKDESGKITHTVFPYSLEGIPMIGEVKRLSAEENIMPLFSIPINIEVSNIGKVGWLPCKEDFKRIGDNHYNEALAEYTKANEKVCFKNVHLAWDSCDCGDGYGCSHGSWVYELRIIDKNGTHEVDIEDNETLHFSNSVTKKWVTIPIEDSSIGDFYRACVIVGIELELSDYAISLINSYSTQPKALITDADIQKMVHENFEGLTDAMGGDEDLSLHYKGVIFECIKEASQSLKGNGFSEDDILSSMWATIGFMKRNPTSVTEDYKSFIKEYIQSLTKPTSAVFTDGEFIKFNY